MAFTRGKIQALIDSNDFNTKALKHTRLQNVSLDTREIGEYFKEVYISQQTVPTNTHRYRFSVISTLISGN